MGTRRRERRIGADEAYGRRHVAEMASVETREQLAGVVPALGRGGDCGIELLRHGVLLVFGAPGQLKPLAGQEHGRTIPLADISIRGPQCSEGRVQSMILVPSAFARAALSLICCNRSGECPFQCVTSAITRSGSRERYESVGLPGNILFVRFGSSSIFPVGSTT